MVTIDDFLSVLAHTSTGMSTGAAAWEYARHGMPVFPCEPGGKRPLTEHGLHDATTNLPSVAAWWRRWPNANIGVPTGNASGLAVVDVDVHGPINGHRAFEAAADAGLTSGWIAQVRSPSGGLHVYYPAPTRTEQRSWQAGRAGVDFRGDGGYIIAPPSQRLVDGYQRRYAPLRLTRVPATPVDAAGLRDFLDPKPPTPRAHVDRGREAGVDVSRLAGWVARRQEGERNHGLFWAACKMAENRVPATDALDVLTAAAGHAGLSEREATTTVRSAYRAVYGAPAGRSAPAPPDRTSLHRTTQASAPVGVRGLS